MTEWFRRWGWISAVTIMAGFLVFAPRAWSFEWDQMLGPAPNWNSIMARGTKVVSVEGGMSHYGSHVPGDGIQGWNLGARIGWMPWGAHQFQRVPLVDGSLELGLEPLFQRFRTKNQNYGGLLAEARYYFLDLSYGPLVPWIAASIGPGGSDINLGAVGGTNRLTGPFLAAIRGEIGEYYFISTTQAVYLGLQGQHFSNGGLNGSSRNFSLNTPWAGVLGYSWFFK